MKRKEGCLGMNLGVLLLMISLILLPIHGAWAFTVDAPVAGPSTQRESEAPPQDTAPAPDEPAAQDSTTKDQLAREGQAGSGASEGVKSKKWWWIGGGVVGVAAALALAGGGGGGGGGSIPFFIPPSNH